MYSLYFEFSVENNGFHIFFLSILSTFMGLRGLFLSGVLTNINIY